MAKYNGFKRYDSLVGVEFMPVQEIEKSDTIVRTADDSLLDLIYCKDPQTNLPCGALNAYLSDKTSEQVRAFIEQKIFKELPSETIPSNIREEILTLDSEFIAKTSRNRFEDFESYEARVKSYFDEIENDKKYQERMKKLTESLKERYGQPGSD